MEESTSLFRHEQKLLEISQRLAEQTDQMLELLAELNAMPHIPKSTRFDLRPRYEASKIKSEIESQVKTEEDGHLALRKGRYQLQLGQIGVSEYEDLKASVMHSDPFLAEASYAELLKTSLLPARMQTASEESISDGLNPYLPAREEEQYLQSMDAYINGSALTPRSHVTSTAKMTSAELNRETQLKNPVSVYNWLRKHEPKVFLQDHEPATEKAPKAVASRVSKRNTNRDSIVKQEPELYDEDGIAVDTNGAGKGKRKRDEDGGYRPKGGNSRPSKRRKEDTTPAPKKGKKLSIDAR